MKYFLGKRLQIFFQVTHLIPIFQFSEPDILLQDSTSLLIKQPEEDETKVSVRQESLELGLVDGVEVGDGEDAFTDLDQVLLASVLSRGLGADLRNFPISSMSVVVGLGDAQHCHFRVIKDIFVLVGLDSGRASGSNLVPITVGFTVRFITVVKCFINKSIHNNLRMIF